MDSCVRDEVPLRDVILHDPQNIRMSSIAAGRMLEYWFAYTIAVAAAGEHFLKHASLSFAAADEVHGGSRPPCRPDGVQQVIDLRIIQFLRIQVQDFLSLVDVQCE